LVPCCQVSHFFTFSITRSVHSFYCLRISVIELSPYRFCLHHFDRTLHYFLYKLALMWLEFLIAEYSKSNSKVIQTASGIYTGIVISQYLVVSWHHYTVWRQWYWYHHVCYHDTYWDHTTLIHTISGLFVAQMIHTINSSCDY